MSNRNRMPVPHVLNARSVTQNGPNNLRPLAYGHQVRPQLVGAPPVLSGPPPGMLEQKISTQHSEIQRLLTENQRLAATHVALRQELAAAQQEVQRLQALVAGIQAEKDGQMRALLDKSGKLEADLRAAEPLKAELHQAQTDCQKLHVHSQELAQQLRTVSQELQRARVEAQQVPSMRAELDTLRQELQRARAAFELEKKANSEQLEQRQAMEKNLVSMARDLEKLSAEHTNAENRAHHNSAVASYNGGYPVQDVTYGTMSQQGYGDGYSMHSQEAVPTGNSLQQGANPGESDLNKSHAEANKYMTVQDGNSTYHSANGNLVQDANLYRPSDWKPAEEWAMHKAPDGKPFYHNQLTGATQWEKPTSLDSQHYVQAAQVPGQVLEGGHVPSVQPNNQTQQEVSVAQMQQGGTPAQQQQLTQYAQPVQNAAQHAASYTAHPGPQMQQAGLYVQHPGVYMPHPGMYMQSGSHLQQPGVYMQQPLTQTPPVAGQIQQPGVPLVAPIPAPLGTQMQPPILPLQGQSLQSTPSTQLPQVVHSPLNYAMPGVMAHQVPTQARGQVQHITQPSQLPPLMPTPVGQQPMQQSSLSQPSQISSSRPGAYSSQSPQRQQPNLQQSQAHPRTPAQAATSQPQSLPQGSPQPSHTPHVSAPPLIHPRPQISETPTPVKSAPLLPLTATSGPQGANLFVFGIPEDMGDKKLADLFSPYGSVVYAKVGVEKDTGRNRTYGFVSMDSSQAAEAAILQVNGMSISGKRIKVELKRGESDGHSQHQQQQQQQQHSQHQNPSGGVGPTRWHHGHTGNSGYRPY